MLRRLAYMFVAAVMLCSCVDDAFHGTSDSLYGDDSMDIPVVVALGDPGDNIVKGSGAIDNLAEWSGSTIYVYAFGRDPQISYRTTSRSNSLSCLVDGSKDVLGSVAGKKARLDVTDSYAIWDEEDGKMIYPSGDNSKQTYDFFAYYFDDIRLGASAVKRYDDAVTLDIEIDGSQDIMSSKAQIAEMQLKTFSERDQALIRENQFSYYTAQRNIVPTFVFNHHLVRLEFEIHAGVIIGDSKTLMIHGLELESRYKANFTVAAKNEKQMGLVFGDDMKLMQLTEDGGEQFRDGDYQVNVRPSDSVAPQSFKLGGCLLVAPSDKYDAYIVMTEWTADGTLSISRAHTPFTITYPEDGYFQSGNQYKVKLTVYSANNVSASVEMLPWYHGGDISMDMENDKPIL